MNSYLHFPLTSARYELDEPIETIGQHFSTDIIPLGQLHIPSGKLAIGDPLLGMTRGGNPWISVPAGSYAVSLTRLTCVDRNNLALPAYLSLTLDADEVEDRRQEQGELEFVGEATGLPDNRIQLLSVGETGQLEDLDEDEEAILLSSRSGVVAMVDEVAFENRMPNPLLIPGGWFERYFDAQSEGSWLVALDDETHLAEGVANIPLPGGPDDWEQALPPTIAMAQMASMGPFAIFTEYAKHDLRRLAPIAIHVELGLQACLHGRRLKTPL